MKAIYPILVRFKIFDDDATLSLTNIMLMVLIGKVAFSPIDWTQLVALFLALLAYNGKKVLRHKERKEETKMTEKLAKLDEQLSSLRSIVNTKNAFNK